MSLLLKLLKCTGEDECALRLAWKKEMNKTEKNIEFFENSLKLGREKLKIIHYGSNHTRENQTSAP